MKRHLLRFAWLYAILLFLLCIPAIMWTLLCTPPLAPQTVRDLARWLDEENERLYGPSIGPEYVETEKRWKQEISAFTESLPRDVLVPFVMKFGVWSELMDDSLQTLYNEYGPMLKAFDELWASGVYTQPNEAGLEIEPYEMLEESLYYNVCGAGHEGRRIMVNRLRFQRALARAQWDEALSSLDDCTLFYLNYKTHGCINICCFVKRQYLYGLYETVLGSKAPAEIKLKVQRSLRRLRVEEPVPVFNFSRACRTSDLPPGSPLVMALRSPVDFFIDQLKSAIMLKEFLSKVLDQRSRFSDPQVKQWAERLVASGHASRSTLTFLPSAISFLRRAARDPGWQQTSWAPASLWESGDPWTMMLVTFPKEKDGPMKGLVNVQVLEWLLDAALGAVIYHDTHGQWPELLVQIDAGPAPCGSGQPSPPLQMAWLRLNSDLRASLWQQKLLTFVNRRDFYSQWISALPFTQTPDGRGAMDYMGTAQDWMRCDTSRECSQAPLFSDSAMNLWLLCLAQSIAAHPQLAHDVQVMHSGPTRQYPREKPPVLNTIDRDKMPGMPGMAMDEMDRVSSPTRDIKPFWVDNLPRSLPRWPVEKTFGGASYSDKQPRPYDGLSTSCLELDWVAVDPQETLRQVRDDAMSQPEHLDRDSTDTQPSLLRLHVELTAPERALVIWHPGPDGVDDGAQIVYDPTNGTASRGDMVISPQPF